MSGHLACSRSGDRHRVTVVHLFKPNGHPTLTPGERAYLRDVERYDLHLRTAVALLHQGLADGNIDLCVSASRSLQSLGILLGEAAREVERA